LAATAILTGISLDSSTALASTRLASYSDLDFFDIHLISKVSVFQDYIGEEPFDLMFSNSAQLFESRMQYLLH
jgi:hypothetical protein